MIQPVENKKRQSVELFGLPRLESIADIASHTRLSKELIFRLSKFPERNYRIFTIPKKTGGARTIAQPSRRLKIVQAWILRHILDKLQATPMCKGFERGARLKDNASPHIGAKAILSLDIEEFFPSITANRVVAVFRLAGYNESMSWMLTSLCTVQNRLPQGSPCSPKLANLVCYRLDRRLGGYAGRRGLIYTRYADDMTFSSYSATRLAKARSTISGIISAEGFRPNDSKTRLVGPSKRHRVTGLVVSHDAVGIGRYRLRELRAKILCLVNNDPTVSVSHVQGWLGFVMDCDPGRYAIICRYIEKWCNKAPGSALAQLRT